MTKAVEIDGVRVVMIEPEADGTCELCGNVDELRPYGPRGERICFSCGMKDPATTSRQFGRVLGIESH